MPTLAEQFSAPATRQQVVKDLAALVDSEVQKKGGLSGLAIKASYGVVKAIKPTFIVEALDGLFDECVARLESLYAECLAGDPAGFASRWNGKAGAIADALLGVTDARAERSRHTTAKKAYDKLRPSAKRNVEEAVPGLGAVLLRHTAIAKTA